jgi:hypothetical protein
VSQGKVGYSGRQKFIAVREALQSSNHEVELAGLADKFGVTDAYMACVVGEVKRWLKLNGVAK